MEQIIETDSSMPEDGGEEKDGVEQVREATLPCAVSWKTALSLTVL